jgi:hypothetical protein
MYILYVYIGTLPFEHYPLQRGHISFNKFGKRKDTTQQAGVLKVLYIYIYMYIYNLTCIIIFIYICIYIYIYINTYKCRHTLFDRSGKRKDTTQQAGVLNKYLYIYVHM